jgi:hypothetical protein
MSWGIEQHKTVKEEIMSQYYVGVKIVFAWPQTRDGVEVAARAAHEQNRHYCQMLGDNSQLSWENAPQWQKDSAIAGVKAIIANPDTTPEQSHEGWLALKASEGWKYGPVKDPEKKEHPCFVPYAELPEEQRAKDDIFGKVVRESLVKHPPVEEGYAVKYPDGYISWSPKDAFEAAYLPMGDSNDNTVTAKMVDEFTGVLYDRYKSTSLSDGKTTLVANKMISGFMEYGLSSCVDPKNYDESLGAELAIKKIKDAAWKCLGFVVQWGKYGINVK